MPDHVDQIASFRLEASDAIRVLRETGTLLGSNLGFIADRIPDKDQLIFSQFPNAWEGPDVLSPVVADFDGNALDGDPAQAVAAKSFAKIFLEHPHITTFAHIHTPYLATWANAQRPFPILYVGAQRHTLAREIPVHIDRTTPEISFILEQLQREPNLPAILEGNGGGSFWGRGIRKTVEFALLLEEAARLQTWAELIGGSKEYGAGVLEQQWRRTGLIPAQSEALVAA